MRNASRWLLTGTISTGMAISGLALRTAAAADREADRGKAERPENHPVKLPAGFDEKDVHAVDGVKAGLAKLAERFVTKGDFEKYLGELAKQDEERTREFKDYDQKKLDGRIDQIHKAWKAKYGKDFDLDDKKVVFDEHFQIVQGEVGDPAVALANWPLAAVAAEAVTASNKEPADRDPKQEKREVKAEKLEKGRNVAVVRFPAMGHLSAMNISMLHQLPMFWRVDVPNSRTGEMIYNDLLTHLTWIGEHSDQWPANVDDGYRMVAHHAVAAAYGVELPAHKGS